MFNRKMKYMFDQYVVAVDKLGDSFDVGTMTPYFDKALVKAGFEINTKQFFNRVWAELDRGNWKPNKTKLNKVLNVMPNKVLKQNLTDNIVKANLKESDWGDYRSGAWVKKQKAISFLKAHNLNDGKPVTVVKRLSGKAFAISIFMGDLKKQVGVGAPKDTKAYAMAYDAVTNEIGQKAAIASLKKIYSENFAITNWPDITDLNSVEYEVEFYPDDDWADSLVYETAEEVAATLQRLFL